LALPGASASRYDDGVRLPLTWLGDPECDDVTSRDLAFLHPGDQPRPFGEFDDD